MHTRRRFLQWSALAASALAVQAAWGKQAKPAAQSGETLAAVLARIEQRAGGRLGVSLRDAQGRHLGGQREDERFPMCSTIKFLLAGAILHEVDAGRLRLDRRVPIAATDLVGNSPITEQHVGPTGLSVDALCQATITRSDNAAANLLLPLVGGPAGLTAFLRANGDAVTRADRPEPELNEFAAGDDRDTTSPAAMVENLRRLLLGDVLKPASRALLTAWLRDNRTGGKRLRAGLPAGWQVGDKTGFNGEDTTNDIAILWPPGGGAPLLLATYLEGAKVDPDGQNAALAAVGEAVARFV